MLYRTYFSVAVRLWLKYFLQVVCVFGGLLGLLFPTIIELQQ